MDSNDFVSIFLKKYSTALFADAAFRAGVTVQLPASGLLPLDIKNKVAGPVLTVRVNNDLVSIIAALNRAESGDVLVISNRTFEVALIGDLIATEAKRKRLAGIIVDGLVRDRISLMEIGLPVFSRGLLQLGPLKLPAEQKGVGEIGVEVNLGEASVKSGDWAFADADGVIFLSEESLPATYEWAEKSWYREQTLAAEIEAGKPLGDILGIEEFLEDRERNPKANFNEHLARLGRAI